MVIRTPDHFDVLIADDHQAFREVVREFLEPRPLLRVHEVDSGEAAIEYARERQIHIVLLDMHMHVLTGLETLRELKELDAVRPCILLTSEATDELREDAAEADAYSVLSKPVERVELTATVNRALAQAYHLPGLDASA
jgi:CheY-like chemotaxis protein